MQEQRAKAKLLAEDPAIKQLPIFYSPVKPDPIPVSVSRQLKSTAKLSPESAKPSMPHKERQTDIDTRLSM